MRKNQRTILILVFILPFFGFSQNEFLDFVINQKNDTIYGTIRNVISKRSVLYEKNSDPERDKIKFRSHKLIKYKKIRFNDKIYTYVKPSNEDGIYAGKTTRVIPKDSIAKRLGDFINIQKRLPDFVITNKNDTIYGRIKDPSVGKFRLLDSVNNKIKIETEKIKIFRFNNEILELKEKIIVVPPFFKKDDAYLKLVLNGKLKLYEFDYYYNRQLNENNNTSVNQNWEKLIFIEKDNNLIRINNLLHKKKLIEIFSENQKLVSKILNKEYIIDNIYLMVKFYNENK
ncbi:hypothetical protein [Algibacter mikhailovii]|uniref:hypothetical protein n=1 Tax=Algibacter mikhailovii TaxID=425498 RepID=UPI00249453E8|nr:hypothetical protein [Algibacter mikhailovii]